LPVDAPRPQGRRIFAQEHLKMYRDANFRQLRISGATADGRPVVAGLFPVVNSEGVGLDLLLEVMHDRRWAVDWLDFLRTAREFGWNMRTTLGRIHGALEQVEGAALAGQWLAQAQLVADALERA
jgi:hypothetical protein